MKELTLEEMEKVNGGEMTLGCSLALAGYGIAIVGAAAATGGVGVFLLSQLALYLGAASIICSCSDLCG